MGIYYRQHSGVFMMATLVFNELMSTDIFSSSNHFNPLSAKFIKWSNTLKQFVGKLPTNCLSVFDHFSGLALKGLSLHTIDRKKVIRMSYNFSALTTQDWHNLRLTCYLFFGY